MTTPATTDLTHLQMPNEAHSRVGTLRFFDGFPDEATAELLFDNLDFQRAVQAYLLAQPAVGLAGLRRALSKSGPANSTMSIWEDLVHPRTVGLTFNTSTSYGAMWVDLHDGPLVAETPPGVLGIVNDAWHRWVVDVGLTGPDKGRGGKFLFLPPGFDQQAPDGYTVVRPRTYGLLFGFRGFRDEHGDPGPAVAVIKAKTRVYPLAQAAHPPPLQFVNVSPEPLVSVPPGDYQFWEVLDEVLQSEPPESSDPFTLGMFASIGIQHGKPFAPSDRMRAVLSEAAAVGNATERALAYRFRQQDAYVYPGSAWRSLFAAGYDFQDQGVGLLDAAAQFYFLAFGVTPAEETKMVGAGSQYALAFVDASGAPFDGGKAYRLRVPPNVPVNKFWSVMAYDTQTRSMLQTGQEWPSVTSQDEGFATNDDGSVDVYFGPRPPPGGGNWIQTVPGKGWFAVARLYGPLEPWFDKTWRLPEIEPLA